MILLGETHSEIFMTAYSAVQGLEQILTSSSRFISSAELLFLATSAFFPLQIPVPPDSVHLAPGARFTSQLVRVSVTLLVISTMEVARPIRSAR